MGGFENEVGRGETRLGCTMEEEDRKPTTGGLEDVAVAARILESPGPKGEMEELVPR